MALQLFPELPVIPREGVERSPRNTVDFRLNGQVIPREGVERQLFRYTVGNHHACDPERGS